MGSVWFLSRPNTNLEAASTLESNFATRKIASIASLDTLLRMHRSNPPTVVVFAAEFDGEALWACLDRYCARSGKIMLDARESRRGPAIPISGDPLDLIAAVQDLLELKEHLTFKDLHLDAKQSRFCIEGHQGWDHLSKRECSLLACLMDHAQTFLTLEQIQEKVWDGDAVSRRTIASQISRLRRKLHGSETSIESRYGEGYRLS